MIASGMESEKSTIKVGTTLGRCDGHDVNCVVPLARAASMNSFSFSASVCARTTRATPAQPTGRGR
jgi:hypothetical protein